LKVVDFATCFEGLTGRSEKLERLTRTRAVAKKSLDKEVGKEVPGSDSGSKFVRCASPASSHCLSRKPNGCCGGEGRSNRNNPESISGFSSGGKKDRKDCTPSCARKGNARKHDGKYVSAAAELACVLLFGHTMSELLDSEETSGSK